MALINIKHSHTLQHDDVRSRVEKLLSEVKKKVASFGSELSWKWVSDHSLTLEATSGLAKGMTGNIKMLTESIEIGIDLPLLLRGLKEQVASQINIALNDSFKT